MNKNGHIHILGICGTFMAGIAVLAKQLGYEVSGSDTNMYPPMSDQLAAEGIKLVEGYDAKQLEPFPEAVIVGNAMKRGNPCIEYLLNQNLPFFSGPAWLYENILKGRWVLAVAGTHGKTTTASILTWILEYAGFKPNFLIGGIPENFGVSARYTGSDFFVIEADEYDTAFFDKRAKFIHYRPRTVVLNNLEFDHADIYNSLTEIQRQFQYLVRIIPQEGKILVPKHDKNLQEILTKECWTPVETIEVNGDADWSAQKLSKDAAAFDVYFKKILQGRIEWTLLGIHNVHNALAAIAAAHHVGVPIKAAIEALASFKNVKRRLELRGVIHGVSVYDDFAHHPTAIAATICALRGKIGKARILAVLECASYTMRTGMHKDHLADALKEANAAYILQPKEVAWDVKASMVHTRIPIKIFSNVNDIVQALLKDAKAPDQILIMSNTSFGGIYQKLLSGGDK